jgi:hypothetical protein
MKISGWYREYDSSDVALAIQAATQTAERLGEDMAIRQDLSVIPLWAAEEPPLEIIRCPAALKKRPRTKIYRVLK